MGGAQILVLDEIVARGDGAHVFAQRHPKVGAPALAQPAGQANMVGMKMGRDHALDRLAAEPGSKDHLPQFARLRRVDAGVDDGPAVLFLDQPQIDVVELEGQRHPQPVDAGRDVLDGAGLRHVAAGKAQLRQQALREVW
jgi:hypothetical protein